MKTVQTKTQPAANYLTHYLTHYLTKSFASRLTSRFHFFATIVVTAAVTTAMVGSSTAQAALESGEAETGTSGSSIQSAIASQHSVLREKSAFAAVLFEHDAKGELVPKCQLNLAKNQKMTPSFIQIDQNPTMNSIALPECSEAQAEKALALADHSSRQNYALLGVDDALITTPLVTCATTAAVSAVLTGMAKYVSKGDVLGSVGVGTLQSVLNSGAVRAATLFSSVYQFSRSYSVLGFVCGEAGVAAVEYLMR